MRMLSAYRRLLYNRALTRLFVGEFVSGIGDWLYLVALVIVIYAKTGDAVLLGVVGAARVIPYVFLSIPAGIAADRYDRRLILIITDLLRGAIMVALAVLVFVEADLLWVVALAILATCFSAFFYPAIGALIPSLVADESELGPANSAWASLDNLAYVIGPTLAGLLIAAGPVYLPFALNAFTFAIIASILWRLPRPVRADETAEAPERGPGATLPTPSAASFLDQLRGIGRPFSGVVLAYSAGSFAFGAVGIATVIIAIDVLKVGEGATGYLNAAIGVGGLAGALLSAALVLRRSLAQPLLLGAGVFAIGLALLGAVPVLGVALVAIGAAALGSLLIDVASETIFQRTVPDLIRGRALGVLHTVAVATYAIGSLVSPILLKSVGAAPVFIALGLVVIAGALVGIGLIGPAAIQVPIVAPEAMRLARLPIFAGLPAARLDGAVRHAETRSVKTGDVVVRQGDPPDRFYVIAEGRFAVTQRQALEAPERRLRTLGADDVFGEIGLLTGKPRSATVTAATDGLLLTLDGPAFLELVGSGQGISARLLGLYTAPAGAGPTSTG